MVIANQLIIESGFGCPECDCSSWYVYYIHSKTSRLKPVIYEADEKDLVGDFVPIIDNYGPEQNGILNECRECGLALTVVYKPTWQMPLFDLTE